MIDDTNKAIDSDNNADTLDTNDLDEEDDVENEPTDNINNDLVPSEPKFNGYEITDDFIQNTLRCSFGKDSSGNLQYDELDQL